MKNYLHYRLEDFVQDPYFRQWVLGQVPSEDSFWPTWEANHPEQQEILEQARTLIIAFQCEPLPTAPGEIQRAIEQILSATRPRHQPSWLRRYGWSVAASVLVVVGLSYWVLSERTVADPESRPAAAGTSTSYAGIEKVNDGEDPKVFELSDGTRITLHKHSKLRLAPDYGHSERVVYLSGEAFFEVVKNPEKPFLVYTGEVVTKVLGTSFQVVAYEEQANISVAVKTGKVTVLKQNQSAAKPSLSDEIVLTPNQQAVYIKANERLVKTLVEQPILIGRPVPYPTFEFDGTPLTEVLASFEKAYGVKIIFDEEVFKNCNLNATLTNEPLFEKLDLICETIQARYEVVDGQVVMYGKKCP
ncbi:FecR family protein [Rhabdobacter roseus]|uniref:Ferric-dicitrate binding protein FerR (Iron transport regulator) n=1 Tax=Rhabdobacter roseus TaxID=1655419 RepID=A0A840U1K4_9BACT|nr:FecR family protein [Rhabdobacter roseus]MBB5286010.1 ferric-dicitrate binding protein FerR (iron transport regulator) [Rhabdobacter roseus]